MEDGEEAGSGESRGSADLGRTDGEEPPVAGDREVDSGQPPRPADSDRTAIRTAWIAAGATVIAAVIGAVAVLLAGGGSSGDSAGGRTAAPGAARTAVSATTATTATSSSQAGGTEWWSGKLVLGSLEVGAEDLDVRPPAHITTNAGNDLYITLSAPAELYALGTAEVAAWQGPGTSPTAADCLSTVESGGADGVRLAQGTVICARTGDERIARLTVIAMPTADVGTATFDAVVWPAM